LVRPSLWLVVVSMAMVRVTEEVAQPSSAVASEWNQKGKPKGEAEKVVLGNNSFVAEEANKPEVAESEKSEKGYELKIEAYEKCKNFVVAEAIEVNFDGILDDLKIDKHDPSRQRNPLRMIANMEFTLSVECKSRI
jgi:hypothetical protein